jgi:GNAT superfamily N-acetyltransferase
MSLPSIKRTNSTDPDFRQLINQLDAELRSMYNDLMNTYDQLNVIEQIDTVVIAYMDGQPAGCGCFKPFDKGAVEIKRMFVHPNARGKGISKLILSELENWAIELGYPATMLETGTKNMEALSLYQKAGYVNIPRYGPYVHLPDSICFRKSLS